MCLVIPPIVILAATMAATAASTTAAIMSGVAQRKAAEANKKAMDQQAAQVRAAGEVEGEKAAIAGSQEIGRAKAAASASGVDVQGQTVLDVLSNSRMMSTWNREVNRRNTDFTANAYEQQGKIAQMKGESASLVSGFNAAGSALGGLSQGYSQAYQMGMFPTLSRGGDVAMPPTAGMGDLNMAEGLA